MRVSLTLIAAILTAFVFGQDSGRFSLTLKCHQANSTSSLSSLDTVYLDSGRKKTIKIYTNINKTDSTFVIPEMLVGIYRVNFVSNNYCIPAIPAVICSKCENSILITAYSKKPGSICTNFTWVTVSPGYIGGWKALSKDFRKNLTMNEINLIRSGVGFKVHFYVTKRGEISDISFSQDLTSELKDIVNKGLTKSLHWKPAVQNGRIIDDELSLTKHDLLSD